MKVKTQTTSINLTTRDVQFILFPCQTTRPHFTYSHHTSISGPRLINIKNPKLAQSNFQFPFPTKKPSSFFHIKSKNKIQSKQTLILLCSPMWSSSSSYSYNKVKKLKINKWTIVWIQCIIISQTEESHFSGRLHWISELEREKIMQKI